MAGTQTRSVAVVGGGPVGSAVATHLAKAGVRVALFQRGKRPPIIVGESLVPAIVPFLRRLGVEEEVASYSIYKPGASFTFTTERNQSFRFDEVRGGKTHYSYNVPRDAFDATLLQAAAKAGVHIFETGARLERVGATEEIRLSEETLAATGGFLTEQPDFIIDASGRARVLANMLEIRSISGPRRDTALHAHLEGVPLLVEGNVHTDRLERGWCWRIPLPGKVSIGLVCPSEHLRRYGDSPAEQFDALIEQDPVTRKWSADAKRVTDVVKYTNYQLRSTRGHGPRSKDGGRPGWAMVGDSLGFVDPVFSSGLLIGMESAEALANALLSGGGSERALQRYEREAMHSLATWQKLVDYFYDGRLFTLFQVGEVVRQTWFGRLLDFHFAKHMPRIFTGEGTTSRYSQALLDFMIRRGLAGNDPRELEVG
jgi:flavin-dependent dehydrogenase